MQTNETSLPVMSARGKVNHPIMSRNGYYVGYDGYGKIPMATGSIIYNYKVDDSCMGIAGDHIELGISPKDPVEKENNTLQAFAYIGNRAKVISGDTEGREGYMTRKHGGIDHVMVYFDEEILKLMTTEDEVLIKACGQGLKLMNHEEMQLMSIDPALLEGLGIMEKEQGIKMPTVACVPVYLMGSGLESATTMLGDYDIMMQGTQASKRLGVNELRSGDLVVIQDRGSHNGPHYRRGTVSVGIAVHMNSYTSGHGPELAVIMSSRCGSIEPILGPNANVANYLHIR